MGWALERHDSIIAINYQLSQLAQSTQAPYDAHLK